MTALSSGLSPFSRPAPVKRGAQSLRGFTLIELLTVIAIIGILAAILIPTVAKVRQTAQFATNVSNVRQWTIANILHTDDHRGYIPWRGPALSGGEAIVDSLEEFSPGIPVLPWWNALPPYINQPTLRELRARNALPQIGDKSIWVSPLAELNVPSTAWAAFTCYAPPRSSNKNLGNPALNFVANINQISDPSRTVMWGETPHFTRALRQGVPYPFINEITSPNSVGPYNRNGSNQNNGGLVGKAALGFFDGSVRTYSGSRIQTHGANVQAERGLNPDGIIWRLDP
jgi:prepilin-type N-terminal cleavage/methylation domain-containing protein